MSYVFHCGFVFFFFKQKTAYEVVSRDWSSDVCSSDLPLKWLLLYLCTYSLFIVFYLTTIICVRTEVENEMAARKAALRSVGVGDGDVFAEPETIKVKEKEIKTVYIEPDKPEQRNVGLQVIMRSCFRFFFDDIFI